MCVCVLLLNNHFLFALALSPPVILNLIVSSYISFFQAVLCMLLYMGYILVKFFTELRDLNLSSVSFFTSLLCLQSLIHVCRRLLCVFELSS